MSRSQLIEKYFDQFVDSTFAERSDLKTFFKNHERRPLFVKNMSKELFNIELSSKIKLHEHSIMELIHEMVRQFCILAINNAENVKLGNKKNVVFDEFGEVNKPQHVEPEMPPGAEDFVRAK